jgi:hypothetical protein
MSENHPLLFRCQLVRGPVRDEELAVGGVSIQELLKPAALGRNVVDHTVEHELVAAFQVLDVFPRTQTRVDRFEIHDRKPPVR